MNKLIIPTILIAVVMIAAGFAFAPIEQATTVHDDIIQAVSDNMCKDLFGSEAVFAGACALP